MKNNFKTNLLNYLHDLFLIKSPKRVQNWLMSCSENCFCRENLNRMTLSKKVAYMIHKNICLCCIHYHKQMNIIEENSINLDSNPLDEKKSKELEDALVEKYSN